MTGLLQSLSTVTAAILQEYVEAEGTIRNGAQAISPEQAASASGMLPPLLWWCKEFEESFELDFPELVFERNPGALTGISLTSVEAARSASPAVFMLSDFLRHEVLQLSRHELDLTQLVENFQEWAALNVATPDHQQLPE